MIIYKPLAKEKSEEVAVDDEANFGDHQTKNSRKQMKRKNTEVRCNIKHFLVYIKLNIS